MHICGQCEKKFETGDQYVDHVCEKTGFTPKDPEHLGEGFKAVSEAALTRGNARAELEDKGKTSEEAIAETRELGKISQ